MGEVVGYLWYVLGVTLIFVGPSLNGEVPQSKEDSESRRSRIRELFETLDDNRTGYLDYDNIVRRLGELAITAAIRSSDKSPTSQSISQARSKQVKSDGPVGSAVMYARELVKECDKTKDGRITFAEFEAFVHQKEKELEEVFRKVCANLICNIWCKLFTRPGCID